MTHADMTELTDASENLLAVMAERHNVAPKRLVAPGPDAVQLDRIFRAASHAPDHGRIQPWRFILIPDSHRAHLGDAFVQALRLRDPQVSEAEIEAAHEKAFRAPCLMLAVVSALPSTPPVPLAERLVSLGCAIQNMLLMAQTLTLGSGITSGQAMNSPSIRALFSLAEHEEGICFLNLGTVASHKPVRARADPSEFVSSL
jgi:nitroreductase